MGGAVTFAVLGDQQLKPWLEQQLAAGTVVTLVHMKFRCKLFTASDAALIEGDVDKDSLPVLKKLASKNQLRRLEILEAEFIKFDHAPADWASRSLPAAKEDVTAWDKKRQGLFGVGGRGKSLSARDAERVWQDAAGHCMYRGCAEDLRSTSLTTKTARVGYLAHIVAADADGPRGNPITSASLSSAPDNVMLMCDAHHRLIDRIAVDTHPVSYLQEMRKEHALLVNAQLAALKYPRAQGVSLLADIGGVPASFDIRDGCQAMMAKHFMPMPQVQSICRYTNRDDRLQQGAWGKILHDMEHDLLELMRLKRPEQPLGGFAESLCIFPLHLVPILVLAGRIFGEARNIDIFQYHRERKSWQWDSTALAGPPKTFWLKEGKVTPSSGEILLSIELTANIDEAALPTAIANPVKNGEMRWMRIGLNNPHHTVIKHPDDLAQFTAIAREAIRLIHDDIRASRVHLIGVAPASSLFRFGQLLQPGHHPVYRIYDRPDQKQPFQPALDVDGQHVVESNPIDHTECKKIALR